MALIIDLKPNERVVIGNALVTNTNAKASLHIEGDTPVMREKEIMRESEATSPCKTVCFLIQMMYLSANPKGVHKLYFDLVDKVQKAAPSSALFFSKINDHILNNEYYKALKEARNLIDHEQEILAGV
jgi:flagellar protein FlbT